MKTLYVSDLDGTLLRSDETTSEYTNSVINNLTDRGMIFSYATARSLITAKKVTSGLRAEIPLIVYNGAFIVDNVTGEVLAAIHTIFLQLTHFHTTCIISYNAFVFPQFTRFPTTH